MRVVADDDPFLTVAEISALSRLSKMTVYRLIHSGDLKAKKIGRNFRVRESAYLEFIKDSDYGIHEGPRP